MANLRILLGFAFVPAGAKKILGQPFTDPANTGPFHEFLHAFHATGAFYHFVGWVQLSIAVLLMTQTFATAGALMALPVFVAIVAFCWSTHVYFTAVMATLMLLGTTALAIWDFDKWRAVLPFGEASAGAPSLELDGPPPIDDRLWRRCGAAILGFYGVLCWFSGGIYRPRGVELDNPAFYAFPLIALFPVVTLIVERARRRRGAASAAEDADRRTPRSGCS